MSDAEFKTLVVRMLKELSGDLNSIKKIQSEIKDTLIKIKNNVQGNNSRVDEAENQPMIWNIRKQNTTQLEQEGKREMAGKGSKLRKPKVSWCCSEELLSVAFHFTAWDKFTFRSPVLRKHKHKSTPCWFSYEKVS